MKASDSTSHRECLEKHAARYHRKTPGERADVIHNYASDLPGLDTLAMKKHAAHVAAWIAYAPVGYIPYRNELQLLQMFVERLGAGLLPTRLKEVLPTAQAVLQSIPAQQVSDAWRQRESMLQQSLQRFRCCRKPRDNVAERRSNGNNEEVESDMIVAGKRTLPTDLFLVSDDELTLDSEVQPKDVDEPRLHDVEDTAADETSLALLSPDSNQPSQLFRTINKWGFLDESQRLYHIKIAEAATRPSHEGFNLRDLAEAVQTAVAALAAPRRKASADASITEGPCSDYTLDVFRLNTSYRQYSIFRIAGPCARWT